MRNRLENSTNTAPCIIKEFIFFYIENEEGLVKTNIRHALIIQEFQLVTSIGNRTNKRPGEYRNILANRIYYSFSLKVQQNEKRRTKYKSHLRKVTWVIKVLRGHFNFSAHFAFFSFSRQLPGVFFTLVSTESYFFSIYKITSEEKLFIEALNLDKSFSK